MANVEKTDDTCYVPTGEGDRILNILMARDPDKPRVSIETNYLYGRSLTLRMDDYLINAHVVKEITPQNMRFFQNILGEMDTEIEKLSKRQGEDADGQA